MRTAKLGVVFVVAALVAACGGGGGTAPAAANPPPPAPNPTPQTAKLHGDVTVYLPQTENVVETEPNDTQLQAHYLGDLRAGRTVRVIGHVSGLSALDDNLDAFRVLFSERVRVSVKLEWQGTGDPDFAVGLWDFISQQYVEFFLDDPPTSPTEGEFHSKGVYALVVSVLQGQGDYVLTVTAEARDSLIPEREKDNEFFYYGQFLGEVLSDDFVAVEGQGNEANDEWDSYTIVCPEAVKLDTILHIPDTGFPQFGEYDIYIYDITGGEQDPPLVDFFYWGETTFEGATGSIEVPAGTLLQVFVYAFAGDATYRLVLRGNPPSTGGLSKLPINPAVARARPVPGHEKLPQAFRDFPKAPAELEPGEAVVLHAAGGALPPVSRWSCKVESAIPERASHVSFALPQGLTREQQERYTLAAIGCLDRCENVRRAEPNYVVKPCAEPDDTFYNLQWHYPQIHLPQAWDITTGDPDVIVAVIDTGQIDHPDMEGRLVPGYDFIGSLTRARDGDSYDPDPTDEGDSPQPGIIPSSYHGGHVAGTIGAATNNNLGVAGVTWQGKIMHLRALGVGGGNDWDLANAILYAAGLPNVSGTVPARRADIINMSLGGYGFNQTLADAVQDALDAGVTIFAAAGNDGVDVPSYPAALPGVISVGAVDIAKNRTTWSNWGSELDIMAPGGDYGTDDNLDGFMDLVFSTWLYDGQPEYAGMMGTSMACPHAAGVGALLLAVDPTLTATQIESILESTAEDLGAPGFDELNGFGLIDAYEALRMAQGAGDPQVPPVLRVSSAAISFGTGETTKRVAVTNVGGQTLNVGPLTVFLKPGESWLSATTVPGTVAASDTSAIEVGVDRTGLTDGTYFGRVQVESNGGVAQIQVLMEVSGAPPGPPDVDVLVRLVNVDTGGIAAQALVNPKTTLSFSFEDLEPGAYRLEAGSDENGNLTLGEAGELFGTYPHPDSPVVIELAAGDDRGPFRFTVAPSGLLPSAK